MFADESGQVQIRRRESQPDFLVRLAAGAGVRGFAEIHFQFAAARTPQAAIRLLRAFEQQDFPAIVEAIQQRSDFIRQSHGRSLNFVRRKSSEEIIWPEESRKTAAKPCRASSMQ